MEIKNEKLKLAAAENYHNCIILILLLDIHCEVLIIKDGVVIKYNKSFDSYSRKWIVQNINEVDNLIDHSITSRRLDMWKE